MPAERALHQRLPEVPDQPLSRNIAPSLGNVSLVSALVEHYRLRVLADIHRSIVWHIVLHAYVADPRLGVVEEDLLLVDRAHVLVGIIHRNNLAKALKVRLLLGLVVIPLIRQRPPHMPVRS